MTPVPVYFVTRQIRERWADLAGVPPESIDAERFRSGIDVWIVQTYLELRGHAAEAGLDLRITPRFPRDLPAIAHRDDLRVSARYDRSYLADTRADRAASPVATWHVVQSPVQIAERSVLIPLWPQPGLVARDAARTGMSTLGFFGRSGSVPGFFRDPAFLAALAQRGITYRLSERDWRDYSATDVCVALRYDPAIGASAKPFSKLVNAWFAEVPALLGPEPAFRWLRRSELDYLEVNSARDILAALDRLRATPGLYEAMVANGIARRTAFTRAAIGAQWIAFLAGQFVPSWRVWLQDRPGEVRRTIDFARHLWSQRAERNAYKRVEAEQRRRIKAEGLGERLDLT